MDWHIPGRLPDRAQGHKRAANPHIIITMDNHSACVPNGFCVSQSAWDMKGITDIAESKNIIAIIQICRACFLYNIQYLIGPCIIEKVGIISLILMRTQSSEMLRKLRPHSLSQAGSNPSFWVLSLTLYKFLLMNTHRKPCPHGEEEGGAEVQNEVGSVSFSSILRCAHGSQAALHMRPCSPGSASLHAPAGLKGYRTGDERCALARTSRRTGWRQARWSYWFSLPPKS